MCIYTHSKSKINNMTYFKKMIFCIFGNKKKLFFSVFFLGGGVNILQSSW